jgi:hypothetical protein
MLRVADPVTTIVEQANSANDGFALLTAIVGGSIGYLLGAIARSLGIPSDVRANNAAVAHRDDALATWVADRDYALRRDCKALRVAVKISPDEQIPERLDQTPPYEAVGPLKQAAIDYAAELRDRASKADRAIADAKTMALHEYRDEARRALLDATMILAQEGWGHRRWRWLMRQPPLDLQTPQRAEPVLEAWRRPSSMNPERHTFPDDATKRTLDDAIGTMPVTGP